MNRRQKQKTAARRHWKLERDLVRDFIALARRAGFRCYAETSDFDVLLVRSDGFQVGIQAKLTATVNVLAQCVGYRHHGPDIIAALVPAVTPDFLTLCRAIDVCSLDASSLLLIEPSRLARYDEAAEKLKREFRNEKPRVFKGGRVWFPPFEPDIDGGVPAPRSMTPWKLGAAKICNVLRERGFVTRADFTTHGVSMGRWTRARDGWLEPGEKIGRVFKYSLKAGVAYPDDEFPWVREGLARELET